MKRKWWPVKNREMAKYLMGRYSVSAKKACRCLILHRSAYYYRIYTNPLTELRQRIRDLSHARVRFGYRRIYMLLQREGWKIGVKKMY